MITAPNYSRTKFFFITLAVLVIYSYGWRVTEINLGDLFRDFHLIKPFVKELTQPDLFSREKKSQTTEIEFFLKADSNNNQTFPVQMKNANWFYPKVRGKLGTD